MVRSILTENFQQAALKGNPGVLTPDDYPGTHFDVFGYEIVQGRGNQVKVDVKLIHTFNSSWLLSPESTCNPWHFADQVSIFRGKFRT